MTQEKVNPNTVTGPFLGVIFGANGDLTKRKLIPALFSLARDGLLSRDFAILGVSLKEMTDQQYREKVASDMQELAPDLFTPELQQFFEERLYYLSGDFTTAETFGKLHARVETISKKHHTQGNAFFYLATAPGFFGPIVHSLGDTGFTRENENGWRRVIIEKPFGRDLTTARALNADIQSVLSEDQIYRIDHYLGKETVQNIAVLRFANGMFQPAWSNLFIDHVQISVTETLGVEHRGGYYDQAGALRDMVPNHIFQLLTLVGMEMPLSFGPEDMRNEQVKVLHAIHPPKPGDVASEVIRGQYAAGSLDGEARVAYCDEHAVDKKSTTETFVALKLQIENQRWAGVPFYLRTGKRLAKRLTEIVIAFKKPPFTPFRETAIDPLEPNQLIIRIQPNEGISMRFGTKVPGTLLKMDAVDMDFCYADHFGRTPATGYDRLLYDCLRGEATLFRRADMVEAGWRAVETVQEAWAADDRSLCSYPAGSWGPAEAEELLARDGRQWKVYE
jgi:glucose-6-phosphate 1-dehydrogenase